MPYDSDPRLEAPSHYNRQACIDAITDFYKFLTTLPFLEPGQIVYPPEEGWPNITKERLAPMGKIDEVVELLARLPYITVPSERARFNPERQWCMVGPDTFLIDFRSDSCQELFDKGAAFDDAMPGLLPPFLKTPPWVISLTTGRKNGDWTLLDTTDGTVTRWTCDGCYVDEDDFDYAPDDPRHWRDECWNFTKPIGEYLEHVFKERLEKLETIAHFRRGLPSVRLYDGEGQGKEESEELQAIYRRCGWPNALRRDECKQALLEWGHEKYNY